MPARLRFGIPSIDELFPISDADTCEKISIVGPDGTGKSILALHLASYYAIGYGVHHRPRVIYVSTDMEYSRADKIWRNFGLAKPGLRKIPFETRDQRAERTTTGAVDLKPLLPGADQSVPDFLTREALDAAVGYLDLANQSAGDDWIYVARILKLARAPESEPYGLMIIDSVAGFETLVGGTDTFGQELSRRERIAQVIRAAAERWHLVLIVEDPRPGEHSAEEFVTDDVIRLRRNLVGVHTRLTLEIEKSRSNRHARGQHPLEIRSGGGSSTGDWQNADDPKNPVAGSPQTAYIQVFPSLHRINQQMAEETGRLPANYAPKDKVLPFGIESLDDMLAKDPEGQGGLEAGSVTALLGDDGTNKSMLGSYFLMGCFQDYVRLLEATLRLVFPTKEDPPETREADERRVSKDLCNLFGTELGPDLQKLLIESATGFRTFVKGAKNAARLREVFVEAFDRSFGGREGQVNVIDQPMLVRELKSLPITATSEDLNDLVSAAGRDRDEYLESCWRCFRELPNQPPQAEVWPAMVPKSRIGYPDNWFEDDPVPDDSATGEASRALAIVSIINWLARHPALVEPAVLLTTRDDRAEALAKDFAEKIVEPLLKRFAPFEDENAAPFRQAMESCQNNIAGQIICRRLPIHDEPAPVLVHILEKSLDEAMKLRFGPDSEAIRQLDLSANRAWKTRVVVDDLRVMASTFPEVKDELFLPYVVFRLRRRGVTSLLIGTYPGRPDALPADNVDADLRTLTPHQIHTWKVSFHGRNRVAVAVIPAMSQAHSEFVRELKNAGSDGRVDLQVDPHFELYSGIEEGKPEAIPLEIRLFNETAAFDKYIREEEGFWRQRFTPCRVPDGASEGVLKAINAQDINDLRALSQLPKDETRPYTLLYQVDDYWARRGAGALMNRYIYLTEKLPESGSEGNEAKTSYVDPFGMFRRVRDGQRFEMRLNCFENYGYRPRISGKPKDRAQESDVDRVPFMWDFGFLLCRREAWERASQMKSDDGRSVRQVWDQFAGPWEKRYPKLIARDSAEELPDLTEWRPFLEACKLVAAAETRRLSQPVPAFDLSAVSPDSVGCLVLEIWASEIFRRLWGSSEKGEDRLNQLKKGISARMLYQNAGSQEGLIEWLAEDASLATLWRDRAAYKNFFPELFKTWLLLNEVLDFASFLGPDRRFHFPVGRLPIPNAIASRHWYKTACLQETEPQGAAGRKYLPVALPGHFTTRGDWYMAVAGGSRSERLADLAMDVLSSRRGNFVRLQAGMGLPVRDLLPDDTCKDIRTPILLSRDPAVIATYGDIVSLGGKCGDPEGDCRPCPDLHRKEMYWLWRSGMADYDRQSRVWGSWLNRVFEWTLNWRALPQSAKIDAFKLHATCDGGDWNSAYEDPTLLKFAELCDILVAGLKQASRP